MVDLARLPPIDPRRLARRRLNVFLVLAGMFLGTLTMLNLLGITRFIVLGSWGPAVEGGPWAWRWGEPNLLSNVTFAVAVGVLPYPVTFLCTDLLSEFFGRRRANTVVLVGLLLNLWVVFILWVGGALPGFEGVFPDAGEVFYGMQALAFGAVTASMIAYLAAQFIDVQLFHLWKWLTRGKWLWLRNNASTLVSQFVDTFAVITITHFYAHALPVDENAPIWPQLWLFIATGYVFKAVAALVDTPIIYAAVAWLTPYLRIDPTQMHSGDAEPGVLLAEAPTPADAERGEKR